jgi:hypothetical protein
MRGRSPTGMVVKLATRQSDNPVGRSHASTGFYQVGISDSEQITRQPEWQGQGQVEEKCPMIPSGAGPNEGTAHSAVWQN